jgi:hypothetical protein
MLVDTKTLSGRVEDSLARRKQAVELRRGCEIGLSWGQSLGKFAVLL